MRVRTFGSVNPVMFKSLGAVPVNMTWLEAYEAMQRGGLDCVYFTWTGFYLLKLHEVGKYVSDANFGAHCGFLTYMNLDKWNSLPANLQDLFTQVAHEAELLSHETAEKFDRKALESMLEAGAELIHFEDQDRLKEVLPDPIALVEKKVAAVGTEYKEPARRYASFLRAELIK